MAPGNPSTVEVYQVLCEIRDIGKMHNQMLADLREIMKTQTATLEHMLALAELRTKRGATNGKPIADARELDSQYGDPVIVAKDPRDWTGDSMKGRHLSECPPEYLDLLAERYDYLNSTLGDSEEDKKKRGYNAKDAARARGWAARLRSGWKAPQTASAAQPGANPFTGDDNASW